MTRSIKIGGLGEKAQEPEQEEKIPMALEFTPLYCPACFAVQPIPPGTSKEQMCEHRVYQCSCGQKFVGRWYSRQRLDILRFI